MSEGKETKEMRGSTPPQAPKKRRWKLAVWGFVILLCGMVMGAGITLHAGSFLIFRAMSPDGKMAEHITKRIDRDLHLTDEQKSQVSKVVDHRVSEFKSILLDVYPRIKEQFELMHVEVAPLLNEEQKSKWEKHYKKVQKVFTRIHKRLLPDGT